MRHVCQKFGLGLIGTLGLFTGRLRLQAGGVRTLFGQFPFGDIGIGAYHPASRQLGAPDFHVGPARTTALIDVRHIKQTARAKQFPDIGRCVNELIVLPLMLQYLGEIRVPADQGSRQIEHLNGAGVADGHHPFSSHHHDALFHVLQGGFEKVGLLGNISLADAQRVRGLVQVRRLFGQSCAGVFQFRVTLRQRLFRPT